MSLFTATAKQRNVEIRVLSFENGHALLRIIYEQFIINRSLHRYRNPVLITPSNVASLGASLPQVLIVQALLAVRSARRECPSGNEIITPFHRLYYDYLLPRSLRKSWRVVTVSTYMKSRLLEVYPQAAAKIRVIPEGVDLSLFSQVGHEMACKEQPFILFLSTLFPYKNADKLIRAFALAKTQGRLPEEVRLKIAGRDPDGKQWRRLEAMARCLNISRDVEYLGAVPHNNVQELYRKAAVFVYPSAMESFGLPPLEAMACGTPVVASNRASVPEVVGDAALVVDPDNDEAFSTALGRALHDHDLRRDMIEKGLRRAAAFSWGRVAEGFLDLIAEIRN